MNERRTVSNRPVESLNGSKYNVSGFALEKLNIITKHIFNLITGKCLMNSIVVGNIHSVIILKAITGLPKGSSLLAGEQLSFTAVS